MGKGVWLLCIHYVVWQHCNLFLMCFGVNRPHHTGLSPSQFTPWIYYFHLLIWLTVLKVTELCMFRFRWFIWALWCISAFVLIRDTPRGAWTLSILWLVAPCLKEIQHPRQSVFLFPVNLSFQRRCPVVDSYLCSVDMESRQMRGHRWVRRCQPIHHAAHFIKKSTQTSPPKARSLPWYHIQSIHYRGAWQWQFNLHAVASLFFSLLRPAAATHR